MSDSRARRPAKPASKAKTSLAQLAELRRTGGKRVHDFELTEEDAVYDEVQEQDYAKLVQDRREQAGEAYGNHNRCKKELHGMGKTQKLAGDFIVDDDGMGYADIGEEEDWGRSDQQRATDAEGHATSKKRQAGSAAGESWAAVHAANTCSHQKRGQSIVWAMSCRSKRWQKEEC